jgi:hypothetical protein
MYISSDAISPLGISSRHLLRRINKELGCIELKLRFHA